MEHKNSPSTAGDGDQYRPSLVISSTWPPYTIVVLGGSNSVSQLAIQVASHYGSSPIIATSSEKYADYFNHIGAAHVVDRDTHVDKVKNILSGQSVEYIYAAVDSISQACVDLLAPGSTLISAVLVPVEDTFKDGRKSVLANGSVHLYKEFDYGLMGASGVLLGVFPLISKLLSTEERP
ncbi:hypothetical protein PQX77_004250 [Marasmius sp. AFHP31]|nr:hypothetical protein PQX77_004250 [Marasmius sp. AFHP31]